MRHLRTDNKLGNQENPSDKRGRFHGVLARRQMVESGHGVASADNLLGGKKENVNPDCKFVNAG